MKCKRWHIALLGILAQAAYGLAMLVVGADYSWGCMMVFGAIVAVVPLLLLLYKKTRAVGAVLSIVLGAAGTFFLFGLVCGIFLVVAGILYLPKKKGLCVS